MKSDNFTILQCINVHHLKKHIGETPPIYEASKESNEIQRSNMLVHDLKIIAISMGLIQYICLLVGCFTVRENCLTFINISLDRYIVDTIILI